MKNTSSASQNMRGYSWGSLYISQIQHGIQGWHAQNQFFKKYKRNSSEINTFVDWATKGETLILLNAGMTEHLNDILKDLDFLAGKFSKNKGAQERAGVAAIPFAPFYEPDLSNAFTAVFAVMPEACYASYEDRVRLRSFLNQEQKPFFSLDGEGVVQSDVDLVFEMMRMVKKAGKNTDEMNDVVSSFMTQIKSQTPVYDKQKLAESYSIWTRKMLKVFKETNPDYTQSDALLDCFKMVCMRGELA